MPVHDGGGNVEELPVRGTRSVTEHVECSGVGDLGEDAALRRFLYEIRVGGMELEDRKRTTGLEPATFGLGSRPDVSAGLGGCGRSAR
jgi:hypothetical protein